jgi:hypothetical protein
VHIVAILMQGSEKGPTTLGLCTQGLSLHFCKRLFLGLEPMTAWSQANSFPELTLFYYFIFIYLFGEN